MDDKKTNSILNKRTVSRAQEKPEGIQTESLQPATVKIPVPTAASMANPYSILIGDYSETLTKTSTVNFVLDTAEVAKSVVKLPEPGRKEPEEVVAEEKPVKTEKSAKPTPVEIPEIPAAPKAAKLSDMEMLNNMAAFEVPQPKEEKHYDIPDNVEFVKVEEDKPATNELEILNQQEAAKQEEDKKAKKEAREANMNDLEAILAELDNEGDNSGGVIGYG